MAHYAIGDIQGCYSTLNQLLQTLSFSPSKDTLWLAGDLINRGPESLRTLRQIIQWDDSVKVVLGNHDIHLLAVCAGHVQQKSDDTIQEILNASDHLELIDWLRQQPLVRQLPSQLNPKPRLLVHAGVLPTWSFQQALEHSDEFQSKLSSPQWKHFLHELYGNQPNRWENSLNGIERLRLIANVCTRMRMLEPDQALDFKFKGNPQSAPAPLKPWFEFARQNLQEQIIFGHWSALETIQLPNGFCVDTGCVWGQQLTALCLNNDEIIQQRA